MADIAPKTKKPDFTTDTSAPKTEAPKAEFAAFEMPKFEMPTMEPPAALREMAQKAISQAKDGYDKMKSAAEDATGQMEQTYATATKGMSDYVLKVVEMSRVNSNAAFDFATQIVTTRTLAEMVEMSTAHARKQYDTLQAQTRDLTNLAQKVATETAEPLKDGMRKATNTVA